MLTAVRPPIPNPSRVPNPSSHSPHLCVPTHTCAGNVVKDARTHVKNGTSSQKEKTIVENIKKGAESRGVNEGYVVLDQHDLIERNARLNTFKTKPTFNIVVTRGNTFYISNGTKELQIGSIHTNKGRKFRVLRKLA